MRSAYAKTSSPVVRVIWALVGAICVVTSENIWFEPWAAARFHHEVPPLVPQVMSAGWFLVLSGLCIAMVLLVFAQFLVMRDVGSSKPKKLVMATGVLAAGLLSLKWLFTTDGMTVFGQARPNPTSHSVTLHWQPSASKHVRYNIYRGPRPGFHPDKINSSPVDGLTYTDTTARSGASYCYVARAVASNGKESTDSSEICVTVP